VCSPVSCLFVCTPLLTGICTALFNFLVCHLCCADRCSFVLIAPGIMQMLEFAPLCSKGINAYNYAFK
jgi:hypothetical protein